MRHTAARKGKGAAAKPSPGTQLEKKVVNCLSCGKIYDCRSQELSNDTHVFLGGHSAIAPCDAGRQPLGRLRFCAASLRGAKFVVPVELIVER